MSAKIMGKVWEIQLPANKLIVLLAMADHADHDGNNVYPSMELIAWKTGYSEKQVRRIVKLLEKDGLLKCEKRSNGRVPHRFSIHLENGKMKAPREIKPPQNVQVDYTQPSQNGQVEPRQYGGGDKTAETQPGHFDPLNLDTQVSYKPSIEPSEEIQNTIEPKGSNGTHAPKLETYIKAYVDGLSSKPVRNQYGLKGNRTAAADLLKAAIHPEWVTLYTRKLSDETYWKGKKPSLTAVTDGIAAWLGLYGFDPCQPPQRAPQEQKSDPGDVIPLEQQQQGIDLIRQLAEKKGA